MVKTNSQEKLTEYSVCRKIFICVRCEGIFPDEPVSQCDCEIGATEFVEGSAEYTIWKRPLATEPNNA